MHSAVMHMVLRSWKKCYVLCKDGSDLFAAGSYGRDKSAARTILGLSELSSSQLPWAHKI